MIITYLAKSFNQASVYQNLLHEKFACFSFYYKLRLKYLNILFFLFRNVISICKWLFKKWLKLVVGAVLENFYYLLSDISQFPLIGDNPYFSIFNAKYFAIVVSREYHMRTWRQGIIQCKLQQQYKKKKKSYSHTHRKAVLLHKFQEQVFTLGYRFLLFQALVQSLPFYALHSSLTLTSVTIVSLSHNNENEE